MTALVTLRDVRLRYAGGFTLEVPALDVRPAEVLAVIGPNGSGKSTLLRVLGLLERPEAGEVRIGGRAVDERDGLTARRRMATVFQDPLLADTTVVDNVTLGLGFRGVRGESARTRARQWLERFGVAALSERPARTLSGGEAQRVALARALVLQPEVLLLDEPFAGLDAPTRAELLPDLGAILRHDRVTTMLVTHDRGAGSRPPRARARRARAHRARRRARRAAALRARVRAPAPAPRAAPVRPRAFAPADL